MGTTKTAQQLTQEELINEIKKRINAFLKKAVRRDGKKYKVDSIQYDSKGVPITLKGTVADEAGKNTIMFWNLDGTALSQNVGLTLVTEEKL